VFKPGDRIVLAGSEDGHGAAEREEQVLFDGGAGQVDALPVDADDVPLIGFCLVCAVLVAAAHASDSNLFRRLERHDEQVAGLDAGPEGPQLSRVVVAPALGRVRPGRLGDLGDVLPT
jgi:hypothetical protein